MYPLISIVLNNVNIEAIINQCFTKTFNGNMKTKTPDNIFTLESNDFLQTLIELNAIK